MMLDFSSPCDTLSRDAQSLTALPSGSRETYISVPAMSFRESEGVTTIVPTGLAMLSFSVPLTGTSIPTGSPLRLKSEMATAPRPDSSSVNSADSLSGSPVTVTRTGSPSP